MLFCISNCIYLHQHNFCIDKLYVNYLIHGRCNGESVEPTVNVHTYKPSRTILTTVGDLKQTMMSLVTEERGSSSSKTLVISTRQHGITSQIITDVRTWNCTWMQWSVLIQSAAGTNMIMVTEKLFKILEITPYWHSRSPKETS
jgi:hypothetical protein